MSEIAKTVLHNQKVKSQIIQLIWEASDVILEVYQSENVNLQEKADASPVTQADLAAHQVLVNGLAVVTPHIPVVSEEDSQSFDIPRRHRTFWLIDPLDGTKEFIHRNGEFTCNLALISDQRPVYGWVSVPVQNVLYHGGSDLGAVRVERKGNTVPIRCQPNTTPVRIVASKSHLNSETKEFIDAIEGNIELVQAGSSLKFLKIAEGQADLYPRLAPTCEWDTAAAHAVLEGAGGVVTQVNGAELQYGKTEILNPHFIARTF
ncbi:3'(2'),5'-bisphosphate nucleotidase CysQ [Litoricolaceae bacterium]|nr:3'(2'),5'-bisphosphate nucleotidase CysQ [Litorivicinaceae bacterium]